MGIYDLWEGKSPILEVTKTSTPAVVRKALPPGRSTPGVSTRTIVARNLFDPDRGTKAVEPPAPEKVPEKPEQSIDGLLLLGTVIAGSERYAIMKIPPDLGSVSRNRRPGAKNQARRATPAQGSSGVRRVRVGDSLRGYRVEGIEEQKVVLTRGTAKTEVTLDYTREVVVPPKPKAKRSKRNARIRSSRTRSRRSRSNQTSQKR